MMADLDPEAVGLSAERLERIRPVLQGYVDRDEIAGFVALIARHGHLAYTETIGYRDAETGDEMTMDTIFRIYSMTKPITSVAALMLYEKGRFQLDDPVSRFIPSFADLEVAVGGTPNRLALAPLAQPITIKHLLTHTAGLAYGLDDLSPVDTLYQQVVAKELFSGLPSRSLEEVISEITALPLANQPGERWRYSVAVDVLGYLVQVIADMPFETFLQTALFEPLGMVDTHFRLPDAKAERLATLYQATPEGDRVRLPQGAQQRCLLPQPCPSGGGGLVSTAPDYFRFAQMLLNGGELDGVRVLGPRTVEFMTLNHLPAALLPYRTSAGPNPGLGFGLGVSVVMDPAATNLPSSIGTYGWGGAAATRFRVDPQEDLVTLIMPQLFTNPHPFGRQFAVMAYQALVD